MYKDLYRLWFSFFYVGLFTIGGGYAMLPLLENEVVVKHKWLDHEELLNVFALGQSTPGIIALNVSTFVGVRHAGILGGITATFGMVLPSLIIIILIAYFVQGLNQIPLVMSIFAGIRASVAALLFAAVFSMSRSAVKDIIGYAIILCGFMLLVFFDVSPIWVVLGGGLTGAIVYGLIGFSSAKKDRE